MPDHGLPLPRACFPARDRRPRLGLAAVGGLFLAGVIAGGFFLQTVVPGDRATAQLEKSTLFQHTNVFRVHLIFTPEQWAAMEPKGGPGQLGGPPNAARPGEPPIRGGGGGPGFGGPGGPGGPPMFGPALFLAPAFLGGDTNGDAVLSADEFKALAQAWFAAWDTNRSGTLDLTKIRSGLNQSVPPPADRFPPGTQGLEIRRQEGGPGPSGGRPDLGGMGGPPRNMLLGAEGKRNGLASAMGIDFPTARADLEFEGVLFPSVAVRYKGNGTFMGSRNSLKRSLKIDLNDHAPGRRIGGATKLNLHTCVTDPSWMNEVLSHKLFRDAGVPAPRTAYARVHVTVAGTYDREYLGLYSIVENVDSRFLQERFGTRKGALFKPVTRELFEDLGDRWAAYRQMYDPKTPVSDEETGRVIAFSKLVSHGSDAEFAARVGEFLDLDAFARFMAVTTWLSAMDSILGVGQNFYLYLHPKSWQFLFIPWDLDHSFGQFAMVGTQEQRENLNLLKPWDNRILFLERVFAVKTFRERYLAVLREFSRTLCKPDRFHTQVDQLAPILRPAIAEESAEKVARFDQVVRGQPPGPTPGAGFGPPGGFGPAVQPIKPFVLARARSVADQLAGKSKGMQATRGGPFGGPGGPQGLRGPGAFGAGQFLGPVFLTVLDADKSGEVSRAEYDAEFGRWFETWNTDDEASLTESELRLGLDKSLAPRGGGPPGFAPQGGPPQGDSPPPSPVPPP